LKNLTALVHELIKRPKETEWIEFKENLADPGEIGEYICALSNAATYHDRSQAYLVWGVNDLHEIVGTSFDFSIAKVGNEELENWLRQMLSENANFSFHGIEIDNKRINMLIIYSAIHQTVKFKNVDYIRVGSYKKKLKDYPAMEAQLWHKINMARFERLLAKQDLQLLEALNFLDYSLYFELTEIVMPGNADEIMHYLVQEKLAAKQDNGLYAITNLGAILFAKRISSFEGINRKSVRVIQYKGTDRISAIRENVGGKGYASGFVGLLSFIEGLLPTREEIEGAFRKDVPVYPPIAMRELLANALIHQDLSISGAGPTVEIFSNRIEITNPGTPLIDVQRFIDNPPRSRNEDLAALMRRMNMCEERGSGWDKVALYCEIYQLPAPKIDVYNDSTRVTVFAHIPFNQIPLQDKKWSSYMHACLKQASGGQMTNTSLRERFGVVDKNKAAISRLIASSIEEGLIKKLDPNTAPRYMCYVPFWA